MLLVTVVASSPSLQGQQSEFTDASGQYLMSNLPPGTYSLLFVYGDAKVKRENVEVGVGKVTVANAKINTAAAETIVVKEKAPTIDAGSTKQGTTIGTDYMKNVPNRGVTWSGVLQSAGGAQGDAYGTSFSGSTSIENNYVVDGLNTTGITLGQGFPTQGSQVLNNFIQEIEVITGGYNAEFGRSTGGVVNVVTKTGSNEFHGTVFGNANVFNASPEAIPVAGSALRGQIDPSNIYNFGFDLGGPIVKDKVWFYVGFSPVITTTDQHRIVSTAVDRKHNSGTPSATPNFDGTPNLDNNPETTSAPGCERFAPGTHGSCEGDGVPDIDPATGVPAFEQIDQSTVGTHNYSYQFITKLNFAVTPEHQGQISFTGQPSTRQALSAQWPDGTLNGTGANLQNLNTDLSVKWTSKFNDNKTQFDFLGGWHRFSQTQTPWFDTLPNSGASTANSPLIALQAGSPLATLSRVGVNRDQSESPTTMKACGDGSDGFMSDPFPGIVNCPDANGFFFNGEGNVTDTIEQRLSAKATLTQRVNVLGHHQFKVGADFEGNYLHSERSSSGGLVFQDQGSRWQSNRFVKPGAGPDVCVFNRDGSDVPCTYVNGLTLDSQTLNWGAFVQDSWSILPNLTINAGLRYEQQRLGYPGPIQSEADPLTYNNRTDPMGLTGTPVGSYAMTLTDLVAPRVGLIYDWTKEGRSKIYANWGRFYESIPLDINNREFGGEVTLQTQYSQAPGGPCGATETGALDPRLPTNPLNCPAAPTRTNGAGLNTLGLSPGGGFDSPAGVSAQVLPGISAMYLDEFVVGAEYEVLEDLRVGVAYQHRSLGNVIEDLSTDGAQNYFVGNPGTFAPDQEQKLLNQLMAVQAADPSDPRVAGLISRLNAFTGNRRFDVPERVYNALQLTASKRFSRNFMVQASYTYSKLEGNYPGLFSPDTLQLDPNITSQYDLVELLANHKGPLPGDIPHNFKLDGYYTFNLGDAGGITLGAVFRAQSGSPYTQLASHRIYGVDESYLMPRGDAGRTPFQFTADAHIAYARKIGKTELSVYFELFNLFNNQDGVRVDEQYSVDNADPVIGGSARDLPYVKPASTAPGSLASIIFGSGGLSVSNGPNGAVSDPALLAKLPIVKKLNFGDPTTRIAPLAGRVGASLSF